MLLYYSHPTLACTLACIIGAFRRLAVARLDQSRPRLLLKWACVEAHLAPAHMLCCHACMGPTSQGDVSW
jgi:hypothetical protein